jgi:uncharacterized protein involved in type VI secretion and phage assembly
MIESLFDALEQSIEDVKRKFYGVTTGIVSSVDDPIMLGRVQVKLPFLDSVDQAPWARVAVPFTGRLHGHYFIPAVDDEVLVAFEHGDLNVPYVIGSLWNAFTPPPLQSPLPDIRVIRTNAGNQIAFTEKPASITIQTAATSSIPIPTPASPTGPHQTIALDTSGISAMTPTKITLQVNTSSLVITPNSITLRVGGSTVSITDASVDITASGSVTIKSSGNCTVQGSLVKIN